MGNRLWHLGGRLAAGLLAAGGACAGQSIPTTPAGAPDYRDAVFNREALGSFFRAAALGRVDIVCIGDSNQLLLGDGWDDALQVVWHERFGLYATGLMPAGENQGSGAGIGWRAQGLFPVAGSGFVYAGVPSPWGLWMNAAAVLVPSGMLWLPSGVTTDGFNNLGLVVNGDSALDVNAPLRYWVTHATFAGGSASVRLSVRQSEFPFEALALGPVVSTVTGVNGVGASMLQLPEAAPGTRGGLNFSPIPYGVSFTGPMGQYFGRVENPLRTRGVSVSTLYGLGGQSARDMGAALLAASDESLSLYFGGVRALQGPVKATLVRIGTGVNDRSETLPSLGPSPVTPGNYPAAFKANVRAIMERIRGVWTLNGWDERELHFLIAVSTPIQGPPDDSLLQDYREVADELALEVPRTGVTHFEKVTSVAELLRNRWLLFDVEVFHLRPAGHQEMARREMSSMADWAAWVDHDGDGWIDVEDLYAEQAASAVGLAVPPVIGGPAVTPTSANLERGVRFGERGDVLHGR